MNNPEEQCEDAIREYDVSVLCCFMSGEMHNMFAVANNNGKTTKQVCQRYDEIRENAEYYLKLRPLAKERMRQSAESLQKFLNRKRE